ncbi:HJR/Mrr/RecB family endonuclease [Anoxybacillus tepidamans]|uniref:HJR/Mrr/RecB family endonuclease n=1 Tax=Anoxybacteroides tepidamans TaxID=265948 RepID=A0A7W8IQN8_9BACL|nr:HJR/Mrr/RecB family endonuclease [Anoxybacillus tepidamans]
MKTPEAKDGGVDMVLTNKSDGVKIAVQVKHRYKSKNQITVKEMRELDSAKKTIAVLPLGLLHQARLRMMRCNKQMFIG